VDVHFLYLNQWFVWDREKAIVNLRKHHVDFETAAEVFFDRLVYVEDASVPEETRAAAIGMTERFMLLLVVHIHYEDNTIRIISAREATRKEQRAYENSK
jgi:uncharacterized DUF497 family protein